ncbi:MAG: hypothetical protein ACM3UT_08870 [Chloroflexota bacterium]
MTFRFNKLNAVLVCVLFIGCVNTEGELEIKGMVSDEKTGTGIPGRNVIVQGIMQINERSFTTDIGQFSTDSSGQFRYTFEKVKDVRYYNFNFVSDSDYAYKTIQKGLYELEQSAESISFTLSRLTDLSIIIYRKSKKPVKDTLSLSWVSNDIFYWSLYPYKIYNYDTLSNHFASTPDNELWWIGGYVNTIVKARVFAEKKTKIYWDLYRNGKKIELTDTITCRRDFANSIYFVY